ncbi:MAG: hypothetical protein WCJ30_28265, partial [Deltaproteobacteria bacterium]
MSDPRRITDRDSGASGLARDLVASARDDAPPAGAKARARAQLDRRLGHDGITTHISALSAAMADAKLSAPLLAPVPVASNPPAAAPVRRAMSAGRAWALAASLAGLIIAAGGVGTVFILRGQGANPNVVMQQAPPAPVVAPVVAPPAVATPTPVPTPPAAPAAGTLVAANTETPVGTPAAAGSNRERPAAGANHGGAREQRPTGTAPSAATNTNSAPNPGSSNTASTSAGGSCASRCHGDIDCLLRCSTQTPAPRPNPGNTGGGGDGPETPSRNDVISAMNGVRGTVTACGQGMTGTATVAITFASSGRVTTANVSPPFAGTPAGSCIARA